MKVFFLIFSFNFCGLCYSQNLENTIFISNSINTYYKRNNVLKSFDERYGKAMHSEVNLTYSRNFLRLKKTTFDLGLIFNCEYLKFNYDPYPFYIGNKSIHTQLNWYFYPGLMLKVAHNISSNVKLYIQGNQYFSGIFLQREKFNNYKSSLELNESNKVFSKADVLVGVNYQFIQREKYQLGFNLAIGTNIFTYTNEFYYRYYANYGLVYTF